MRSLYEDFKVNLNTNFNQHLVLMLALEHESKNPGFFKIVLDLWKEKITFQKQDEINKLSEADLTLVFGYKQTKEIETLYDKASKEIVDVYENMLKMVKDVNKNS